MSEEFKVKVGIEIDDSAFGELKNQINGVKIKPIEISIDTGNIKSQTNAIRNEINSLSKEKINLTINSLSLEDSRKEIKKMQDILGRGINGKNGFGFSDSSIRTVTKDLENMDLVITKISTKFRDGIVTLTVDGIDNLGRAVTEIKELREVKNDLGEIEPQIKSIGTTISQSFKQPKEVIEGYKELVRTIKEIGNINAEITLLNTGDNKDLNYINSLISRVSDLESRAESLQSTFGHLFNDTQVRAIEKARSDASYKEDSAYSQAADDVNNKRLKQEAKESNDAFKELLETTKQIISLNKQLSRLDINVDTNEIAELTVQLERFQQKRKELLDGFDGGLDKSQLSELSKY